MYFPPAPRFLQFTWSPLVHVLIPDPRILSLLSFPTPFLLLSLFAYCETAEPLRPFPFFFPPFSYPSNKMKGRSRPPNFPLVYPFPFFPLEGPASRLDHAGSFLLFSFFFFFSERFFFVNSSSLPPASPGFKRSDPCNSFVFFFNPFYVIFLKVGSLLNSF